MGNDNSKSTLENQQLIMQLQQQLLNNQNQNQHQQQPQRYPPQYQPHQYPPPQNPQQYPQNQYQYEYPQKNTYPQQNETTKQSSSEKLFALLGNKEAMREIDKNPNAKRKLLEKLLNEHRHTMTSQQVTRINQILNSLPPPDSMNMNKINNKFNTGSPLESSYNPNKITNMSAFNQGTMSQDIESRQLQKIQQLNTIDSLTKHYKTEAEEEEARFKIEEEKRRIAFIEQQKQRRLHYQSKLSDLEKSNIDALKLFQLQSNYSIDELKTAYKKLAMKTHPDKAGGNVEQFQLVTKCYMSLLEKYKDRETNKNFNDIRTESKDYILKQQAYTKETNSSTSGKNSAKVDKDKFDSQLFNKIYEQNKLWESGDDGYGDWFKSNENNDAPDEVFGKKFNVNVFNSTFEDNKERNIEKNGAIQQFHEPQELVSCSTGFTDIDIFARKIDDFSKPLPVGNGGKADLAYTDLKTAYTSKGAFIDPNKVEYKQYKNVDELKRDRSTVRFDMTPEQMREYEMKKRREIEEEERRQELIRQRDSISSNNYSSVHTKMLGYKGSAGY